MPEKEVTPATTPIPNTPKPATNPIPNIPKPETNQAQKAPTPKPQAVIYKYAGKESMSETLGKIFPKQLIPTKTFGSIFGGIFLLVIIIAAFQLPFSELLSGNVDINISIGYPLTFLELELKETDTSPVRILNLILDILIYIALAYAIDIVLNLILKNPLLQSDKKSKQIPVTFKNKKPSIAEKTVEKIAEKKQLK